MITFRGTQKSLSFVNVRPEEIPLGNTEKIAKFGKIGYALSYI